MNRPGPWLGALLLLATGCLGAGNDASPTRPAPTQPAASPDWPLLALPVGDGHDHARPDHHAGLSTPNFRVLGWDPISTDYHQATSGGHYCGDASTVGARRLAVVHSFTSDVALIVLDVTDAGRPRKVGELALPRTHVYDAAIVPDGTFAILATSPTDTGPDPRATQTLQPKWTDECGRTYDGPEQEAPFASGVVLVSLADPRNPTIADFVPQPALGAHSVFATLLGGTRMVLASTTNLVHQISYFSFFTIESTPAGAKLAPYGTFDAQYPDPSSQAPLSNGHVDGWIQQHPVTRQTLAYLANWNGGLIVVHLEGPGRITPVAMWNDYDASRGAGMTGQIHEALPMTETWDGKHYTFIGQEIVSRPTGRATGQVILLDTTDPVRPKPVSRWTLPVAPTDLPWGGPLMFSTHYVAVVERTLFVALYHGGVWAADATPGRGTEMATLGAFIPDRVPPRVRAAEAASWAPEVLDVLALPDGTLVTFDAKGGAYTLAFDRGVPVPIPPPWTDDAWIR